MEGLIWIIYLAIGGVILYCIIAFAVKWAVREALLEFKEDIMKEINSKKEYEEDKNK